MCKLKQFRKCVSTFEGLLLSGFISRHNFLTLLRGVASFGGCYF